MPSFHIIQITEAFVKTESACTVKIHSSGLISSFLSPFNQQMRVRFPLSLSFKTDFDQELRVVTLDESSLLS